MERIGRYEVERELGRGTMSIVYKAFDPRIDRFLAVKVLREKFAREVASRQRFLREARAAGSLGHPNIVTLFDVGQVDGMPYLAMELLEGDTLGDRLERSPLLSVREVLDLVIQLTSALSYAHNHGVIHRDLKPANVHFDSDSGVAKLLDFGIAGSERRPDRQQGEGSEVVGTPAYMAPEQITNDEQDARCDLYALGVLLYRLLAGRLPFDGDNVNELMARVVSESPRSLEPLDGDTPRELIELTHRLLSKQPAHRPDSASEVLEELQDIRAALDRGLLDAARRRGMAWRWPLAVGAAVALVLGVGLWHVHQSQKDAMASATFGFGEGVASVIAREVAEPLLLDDSTALGNLVTDFASNPQVRYLHISDREGVVRASTHLFLQDEPVPEPAVAETLREESALRVLQSESGDFEFQVPVRYQGRRLGGVHLGIDGGGLTAAARSTLGMMVLVFLIAMLAVMIGLAWLVRRQRRLIERMAWGLRRIGRGQYGFRLDDERRDEFGTLYRRFNDMALRLEERHGLVETAPLSEPAEFEVDDESGRSAIEKTAEMHTPGADTASKKISRFPGSRG